MPHLDWTSFMREAFAIYACDGFGNDVVSPAIWERKDSSLDLIPGDGETSSTFPTFVEKTDHELAYYTFDGVDDYVSGWPTMPTTYTVCAAFSSSYPDAHSYVSWCNNDTIQSTLTTPGGFTGNVHSILIFGWELSELELNYVEQWMLRRAWRDTFVDPFTARLIRTGEFVIQLYGEYSSDPHRDYAQGIGSTDLSTVWDEGITFPTSTAALVMDADSSLNLDAFTVFLEAPDWDLDVTSGYLFQNGTSYSLSISASGGNVTLDFCGSTITIPQVGYRTLAIVTKNGEYPKFYADGKFLGVGNATVTISTATANQLYLGNNITQTAPFHATLKKFSMCNVLLSEDEIRTAHIMALAERPF